MKRMRVCVVTGTRAEFGIWRPVLDALHASKKLHVQLLVTGMHLQPEFGNTVKDIRRAGYPIVARVPMYSGNEPPARSLARGIEGMARAFRKMGADLVMVLGDRLEMLAAASAALAERIRIGHLHGGETAPGTWDEQIRHAITKMAHLHFCATQTAGQRIVRMGEEPARVHVVGAPALDTAVPMANGLLKIMAEQGFRRKLGVQPLLLLHPSSQDATLECRRTVLVINTLQRMFSENMVAAVGPNNDPGHEGILKGYRQRSVHLRLDMSVPQEEFWGRMVLSGLLVGNSSSGIIEAASFGVPVINIGERQAGRERSDNVIDVPWDGPGGGARGLERAIRRVLTDKAFARRVARRKNVYGDGKAAARIVRVLEELRAGWQEAGKRFWEG